MKRAIVLGGSLALLLIVAFFVWPRGEAVDQAALDAPAQAAERKAQEVWRMDASSVGMPFRALGNRAAVIAIEREPGHCDAIVPGEFYDPASHDYRGRVATLGPDNMVMASVAFTCGGLQFASE